MDLPEVKGLCCFSFDFVPRQKDVDFCCFLELVCAQGPVLLHVTRSPPPKISPAADSVFSSILKRR